MKIIIDKDIPFIDRRLDGLAEVVKVDQNGFTPELVADADALMIRTRTRCCRELLEGSRVSLIATATIGTDQIDIPWCESAGIKVENAAGCNAPAVAQHVISTLLHMGFDGCRMPLGIVGYGHIGTIVADWARRIGWQTLVCDPPRKEAGMADEDYIPLEELLAKSGAVTVHTPMTRTGRHATHHLIGERQLTLMPEGSILVNAARGPIVDNKALLAAIRKGRVRAAIDTWEGEPDIMPELLDAVEYGSCHIAGYSRQGKQRATRMALEALERHFGIEIDKSGLEPDYKAPSTVSAEAIATSYDPEEQTRYLRSCPQQFDRLRAAYELREEPTF